MSTPARTIFGLSVFVLFFTIVILVIIAALLEYSVVKFRGKTFDAGREPAQVYGSTRIERAWTVIPVLIVALLFLGDRPRIAGTEFVLWKRRLSLVLFVTLLSGPLPKRPIFRFEILLSGLG